MLEMKVPSPGESITEVEIATWLVNDGDYVEKDQAIAEVDSDKATLELPAEESGIITLKAEEGDTVEVGQVVCLIDTSAARPEGSAAPSAAAPNPEPVAAPAAPAATTYATGTASPAAKKMMAETGASVAKGTGKDGRITKADVIDAVASMGSSDHGERAQTRKKMSSLRRKLASRLVTVKNETAMLTTFNEVDMKPIFDLRNEYKEEFFEKHGVKLGFMSFFTLATTRALKLYPSTNSMIDGNELVSFDYVDVSVAVSGPKGLMVPVVRNAETLDFAGVENEIGRLAKKVRDGKITVDEMTGGTFTITNGGVFGSMLSTPIINPPQSAILGMHNIIQRPVAVDGEVVIRPMMYVALSYDHRVIDGRESVGTLVAIKEALENPAEVLMEGNVRKALGL
ncbi:MAG: 2-oxoglutarate dehydrogenase complex dihydrolipoyllysine-residue succinyltransferase [Cryomorphaceae bacterium]|jgi:2-oxoglutarate dehydrogenase E2 component (dihydrolipoamide succinyltransferase)|nr:2-oxoglutarate dehydrogenase complex dihydrolipoyllysine-residue succinyltransferase [Cryomorphaceae bacterium]MCH9773973.1 2-oxoglutarate dehydrogenase complex dihydrolipoyllysine-residue succinyltransferase [Bacteroidota bacterium]MCO4791522.1 2-oxoglutarate dehydrogenase complex dihydrolipoyllysine-residue succinyltransferase [Flavobacteriales bacterium]MDA9148094.1 2-oxoglutarate dehydrogenase complex dihydrolipoyllysine-residue succinyltransferase [Schleiferiaceae bacterium]MBL6682813.1